MSESCADVYTAEKTYSISDAHSAFTDIYIYPIALSVAAISDSRNAIIKKLSKISLIILSTKNSMIFLLLIMKMKIFSVNMR
jgi:hypothetical protein